MKRKFILFLLYSFSIALIYFILSLVLPLPIKNISLGIMLFDILIFIFLYLKKGIRNLIKFSLYVFIFLLLVTTLNYFIHIFKFNLYVYLFLFLDFVILLILYIRKNLKSEQTILDKIFKFAIFLIPIIIIIYVLYMNIAPFGQNISLFHEPEEEQKFLGPLTRVTNSTIEGTNHLVLANGLVYFDEKIQGGTDKVNVKIKFYNQFPEESQVLKLGAKDREDWHYIYKTLYNPLLDSLNMNLIKEGSLRLYQKEKKFTRISDFLNNLPLNSIIATDQNLEQKINLISNYKPSTFVIDYALRGTHNFYVYVKGDLKVDVIKRDINWYENEEILNINLYSLDNTLISSSIVNDDGIIKADKKASTKDQSGSLFVNNLQEGVYRLELNNNGDMIIKKITINQNKIVTNSLFLADSEIYNLKVVPRMIYTKSNRNSELTFKTWHAEGFQNVKINNKIINISKRAEDINFELKPNNDFYEITTEKNDLIISSINYFSFTKDSYFEPFKYKVVSIKNDAEWLKKNVNYIYTDYTTPIREGNWIIGEATFNINETYIKGNKLNFLINAPHLGIVEYQNYTIPIDNIKVTITKEPIKWK